MWKLSIAPRRPGNHMWIKTSIHSSIDANLYLSHKKLDDMSFHLFIKQQNVFFFFFRTNKTKKKISSYRIHPWNLSQLLTDKKSDDCLRTQSHECHQTPAKNSINPTNQKDTFHTYFSYLPFVNCSQTFFIQHLKQTKLSYQNVCLILWFCGWCCVSFSTLYAQWKLLL